jgi:hypothetical protein
MEGRTFRSIVLKMSRDLYQDRGNNWDGCEEEETGLPRAIGGFLLGASLAGLARVNAAIKEDYKLAKPSEQRGIITRIADWLYERRLRNEANEENTDRREVA